MHNDGTAQITVYSEHGGTVWESESFSKNNPQTIRYDEKIIPNKYFIMAHIWQD
jgi:hypothetical protein